MNELNDYFTSSGVQIGMSQELIKSDTITESDLGQTEALLNDAVRSDILGLLGQLSGGQYYDLSPSQMMMYYRRCAPVYNAVNTLVEQAVQVHPRIWSTSRQVFVPNHKVLSLLQTPNPIQPMETFMEELYTYYKTTGNAFVLMNLSVNNGGEPISLQNIHPEAVVVGRDEETGLPKFYQLQSDGQLSGRVFNRTMVNGQFRYRAGRQELYHIQTINTDISQKNMWGMSCLSPILPEITQYMISGTHNTTLLQKGGRLTGAVTTDAILNQKKLDGIREDIKKYEGAANAGKMGVFHGGLSYQSMGSTNKDMDFISMKEQVTTAIYNNFGIPLAFVNPTRMTFSNLDVSMIQLFDRAVLPFLTKIQPGITKMLMPLYPDSQNLKITYNDKDIPALEIRRLNQQKLMNQTEVYEINEVRSVAASPAKKGGNLIYRQSNQIPVAGSDYDSSMAPSQQTQPAQPSATTDQQPQDQQDQTQEPAKPAAEDQAKMLAIELLRNVMGSQINDDGSSVFSDDDIENVVEELE